MQIGSNTTGLPAELTVATDKDGRDWCVVVVKGTFVADTGQTRPAEVQVPLTFADDHYGDPGTSSTRSECDFARFKPYTDVLLRGHAVPPDGRPVTALDVTLEVGELRKTVRVVGDRIWQNRRLQVTASAPQKFERLPLLWERAFGGTDAYDRKGGGAELRNPVGRGYQKNPDPAAADGQPLPNLEDLQRPLRSWSDRPPPAGFGVVGRGWQPRIRFAGTYDDKWLRECFPFLPADFDDRYFQAAPADQQLPYMQGGAAIRCTNVRADGPFRIELPEVAVPLTFRFRDRDVPVTPNLDTVMVEPDERRVVLVWRGLVPLGRKLAALREVLVGTRPVAKPARAAEGKRRYASLADLAAEKH